MKAIERETFERKGEEGNRITVEASEIQDAIKKGKNICVEHAIIEGNLDISNIGLKRDEKGNRMIQGDVSISHSEIKGYTGFRQATFGGYAGFIDVTFRFADFSLTTFSENASFSTATFGGRTFFYFATFTGGVSFMEAIFSGEKMDFKSARFQFPASFEKVKYWSDSLRVAMARKLGKLRWKDGRFLKRILFLPTNLPEGKPQKPTEFLLDSKNIDEVTNPNFKRYVADQQYIRSFKENNRFVYWAWRITSNCGRSMLQWMLVSAILAFGFGLTYWLFFNDCFGFTNEKLLGKTLHWYDYMYYSVVTFTTLGFGDIVPTQPWARFVVAIEVVLGYIMLGGLISIFANKLARRS